MGLNWANGFSQAGAAVAQLGMEGVKAALENDKIRLADELASARQSKNNKEVFDYGQQAADAASVRALKDYEKQTPLVAAREGLLNKGRVQLAKDEAQARLDVADDPANVDRHIETLKKLAPVEAKLKADADVQAVLAKVGTPGYIEALHKIAQASQVLTPGQVAEGELNKLRLSQARTLESMRTAYVSAVNAGNTEEANGIVKAISAYTYDPAKVKDNAELKAAQAVLTSMDATAEDKANAIKFIQRQMADVDAKTGMAGSAPAGAPPVGTVINGKEFTGGNPNDKANWKPVKGKGSLLNPAKEEPTTKLAPGQADPNDAVQRARSEARRAEAAAAEEEARKRRLQARQQDAAIAPGFSLLTR